MALRPRLRPRLASLEAPARARNGSGMPDLLCAIVIQGRLKPLYADSSYSLTKKNTSGYNLKEPEQGGHGCCGPLASGSKSLWRCTIGAYKEISGEAGSSGNTTVYDSNDVASSTYHGQKARDVRKAAQLRAKIAWSIGSTFGLPYGRNTVVFDDARLLAYDLDRILGRPEYNLD